VVGSPVVSAGRRRASRRRPVAVSIGVPGGVDPLPEVNSHVDRPLSLAEQCSLSTPWVYEPSSWPWRKVTGGVLNTPESAFSKSGPVTVAVPDQLRSTLVRSPGTPWAR
jgi:hypothetical protein